VRRVLDLHGRGILVVDVEGRPGDGEALAGGDGFAAATIGQVIIARDAACLARCRRHELTHVQQCLRWGPFFPLVYVGAGLRAAVRARRFSAYYWDNPFEQEARAAEADVGVGADACR
jgi:hypothetical protein